MTIDHSQLPPAPANIVRKSGSKILLTQALTFPMTFDQAETYCQLQFGQGWRLVNAEPLAVSTPGCNPSVDHAAFPTIAADTEVWSSTGIGDGARVFSFKSNDSFPAPDTNPRRVMCVRVIP